MMDGESNMNHIETGDYLVRLLDPSDPSELREVQRLRYEYLLKDFDEKKNEAEGLDDDGYDPLTESIKETGRSSAHTGWQRQRP